ncbi:hypothetical protein RHGRI_009822 [Rhododendron griersonianum]|uniref:non-specific serine/threonine protein kinase n=1 Tax=Rhododendron griersonianum TaxID=479676 RepID=A0AAV6KGW6_9ERIC|nr:hypothetical protein RHGRI_009822 [Rhododendron griersonianum]
MLSYSSLKEHIMRIFQRNFASLAIGILFISFTTFASAATRLPLEEVEALKEIGKKLGKTWDFSVDPCTFSTDNPNLKGFEDSVTCTPCNDTVCHITRIALKSQDLLGTLPPELARLTHLQDIDLTRNYLSGTIPSEWGSLKLVHISLLGNRLTGPIPIEFGNISTLANLTVEFNQLSGPIPAELGSLPLLEKLHLTSNNFTGELPDTLAKLTTLKDFRIGDNHFTGKIPDFIQNWVNLTKLVIQASGLDGPIPLGIGLLTKLSDLRISDLNGSQASFPPLNNLRSLKTLILRSCNIIGPLPQYLGTMTNLEKLLDLSFNRLSGEIPSNFISLSSIQKIREEKKGTLPFCMYNKKRVTFEAKSDLFYIVFDEEDTCFMADNFKGTMDSVFDQEEVSYLTGNLLSGPVPGWMLQTAKNIRSHLHTIAETEIGIKILEGIHRYTTIRPLRFRVIKLHSWVNNSSTLDKLNGKSTLLLIFHITTLAWGPKFANRRIRTCLEALQRVICRKFLNLDHGISVTCIIRFIVATIFLVDWSSFYINCGGKEVSLGGNMTYEDDENSAGPSKFYQSRTNWAFSSTGHFLDDDRYRDSFIWTSLPNQLSVKNLELYTDARISPISLTYYGFCLVNGKYTVNLHFAEIMFNDGKNYSSLGRRIFHIYIQGKMVQKDFNIADEAGGIGKEVIKEYTANVTDGTLEIRFYWAGKGTTGLPVRGVYGPLISAISVHNPGKLNRTPLDFKFLVISWDNVWDRKYYKPPPEHTKGISTGAVVGIVAAAAFVIILLGIVCWRGFLIRKDTREHGREHSDMTPIWAEARALVLKRKGDLMELVDPKLGSDFNKIEVTVMINVALLCANVSPAVRPAMSSVVSMLEGRTVPESSLVPDPDVSNEQKGMMIDFQRSLETDASEGQIQSMSTDGPSTAASTSGGDLYPLNWDSDILNR